MAEIVVGQSIYLPSSVSLTAVGSTAATVPTINGSYQNVGIQLDVTPFIGANSLVQMILEPQITSIDTSTPGQVIEGGSLVLLPRVCAQPQQAFRQHRGRDARRRDRSSSAASSPATSRPTTAKSRFWATSRCSASCSSSAAKSSQKNDLLIFITPHIVQMPSQLAAMSAHETGQTPMITDTNSVSEQELDRYLDTSASEENP